MHSDIATLHGTGLPKGEALGRPVVLHAIDSLRTGGAEMLLTALVGELAKSARAHNIVVVTTSGQADHGLLEALRRDAEAVILLDGRKLYDPRLLRGILRAIRGFGVDVVQSHLCVANVNSRLAAALSGRPHVATLHTPPGAAREDSRARAMADAHTARLSTVLVCPSRVVSDAYIDAYPIPPSRFRVIPNGPRPTTPSDGLEPARLRYELAGSEHCRLIACVSRLQSEKGIDELIEASAVLRSTLPDAVVVVAGGGPELDRLREKAAASGAGGAIRLLGPRSDVGDVLAVADAFCLPSRHEGLPMSLLEAMSTGLPCVATAVGGVPDLVADGVSGLLVPPLDPASLADALARVLSDPPLATSLGREAKRMVEHSYSLEIAAARYADIYDEVAVAGRRS